jgi:hypothetical protein
MSRTSYTKHVELNAEEMSNLAAWDRIVLRAWKDEEFKQKLIDDPNAALADMGFHVPRGANFVIVENTLDRRHLVLPAPPSGDVSVTEFDRSPLHDYDPGF